MELDGVGMKGWGDGDCYGFASNAEVLGMLFLPLCDMQNLNRLA
jgi:hypothetical protein